MYGERRSFAPIQVGDEVEVTIDAVGAKGDGIAKIKGFVIFVPGAKQGETVKVKITKVFRKMSFAEIVGQGSVKAEGSESQPEEENNEEKEEENSETDENKTEESFEQEE